MSATVLDLSAEAAFERYSMAQRAFLSMPCRHTGDVYRERAFRFWRAFNGSSAGWESECQRLDRTIARAIAEAEEHA